MLGIFSKAQPQPVTDSSAGVYNKCLKMVGLGPKRPAAKAVQSLSTIQNTLIEDIKQAFFGRPKVFVTVREARYNVVILRSIPKCILWKNVKREVQVIPTTRQKALALAINRYTAAIICTTILAKTAYGYLSSDSAISNPIEEATKAQDIFQNTQEAVKNKQTELQNNIFNNVLNNTSETIKNDPINNPGDNGVYLPAVTIGGGVVAGLVIGKVMDMVGACLKRCHQPKDLPKATATITTV